jgi:sterol desaturase/sphingolipid hydroxylase (fatty acid hydroxylase superfamily)
MDFTNDPISQAVGIVVASVFITGLVIEFLLSRLLKKGYFSSEFLIINLSISFLQQLADVLSKVLFIGTFVYVQQHYSIQKLAGWQQVEVVNPFSPFNPLALFNYVFVIAVADFCQYWLHRFSHEVNILWAGHITHHSNSEYNYGVALRQNVLENFYTWVFYLPLAFFGIPWQMFVAAYAVSLIWQFFVHTRMINRMGVLEVFMSTPSHHRVHHGKNPQYIDMNYGAFFIIGDKLFGTFEPEVEEVEYGITEPLHNQNPVWSCVHHHVSIIKTIKAEPVWQQKLKWIFGKPSAIYAGQKPAGLYQPTIINQPEKKLYVFINFLLVAVAGFLLVNYYEQNHNILVYLLALLSVAGSFSIFTALLENKRWADYAEVARLVVIAVAGLLMLFNSHLQTLGIVMISATVGLLLFTAVIANRYKKHYTL